MQNMAGVMMMATKGSVAVVRTCYLIMNTNMSCSVMECSGVMDCEDGYACVGANAGKKGECLLV